MKSHPISCYDRVTLRPLNILGALHDPDFSIQIVPTHEADATHGRVSVEAPLGRAVLHRRCGDEITVRVQDHAATLHILAVEASHRSAQVHNTPGRISARPVKYR